MKTNTNTGLREQVTRAMESVKPLHYKWTSSDDEMVKETIALIDQYVHQKTIEARIQEIEPFLDKRITMVQTLYRYADKRQAELQASLNTEGEDP